MSQESVAHQASFGLTPPAPREKRFGEDEFSEGVNSMLEVSVLSIFESSESHPILSMTTQGEEDRQHSD